MSANPTLSVEHSKSASRAAGLRRWLTGLAAVLLIWSPLGCSTDAPTTGDPSQEGRHSNPNLKADSFSDNPEEVDYSTKLAVPLEPGAVFDFCLEPQTLNLPNARWLAFIAANEYAHFGYLGPLLSDLGFGYGSEGWLWGGCARDLYAMRERAESGLIPAVLKEHDLADWGICSRQWFQTTYLDTGAQQPVNVPAAFEHYLVQEVHPASRMQFFSGGAFTVGEKEFESGSTQVVWAQHGELPIVLISFRGTEIRDGQEADIWADLDFFQEEIEGWGKVHGGFRAAFASVENNLLMTKLEEIRDQEIGIWITGHSLGAALATLMTARILDEMSRGAKFNLKGLYTFGSPRVGNKEFAARFDETAAEHGVSVMRFRHGADAVTRIPFSIPLVISYQHVGTVVYMSPDGERLLYGTADRWEGLRDAFEHHSMVTYYDKIVHHLASPRLGVYKVCDLQDADLPITDDDDDEDPPKR